MLVCLFACCLPDGSLVCSFAFLLGYMIGLCLADGLALLALANWMESYLNVIAEFRSRYDGIVRKDLYLNRAIWLEPK